MRLPDWRDPASRHESGHGTSIRRLGEGRKERLPMMPTSEEQPSPASATSAPDLGKFATEIDHIAIAVRNLEQSITFFCNVLGFELLERRKTEGKVTALSPAGLKTGPITVAWLE